jgi:hypothetical protein
MQAANVLQPRFFFPSFSPAPALARSKRLSATLQAKHAYISKHEK